MPSVKNASRTSCIADQPRKRTSFVRCPGSDRIFFQRAPETRRFAIPIQNRVSARWKTSTWGSSTTMRHRFPARQAKQDCCRPDTIGRSRGRSRALTARPPKALVRLKEISLSNFVRNLQWFAHDHEFYQGCAEGCSALSREKIPKKGRRWALFSSIRASIAFSIACSPSTF